MTANIVSPLNYAAIPDGYRTVPGIPQVAVNEQGEVWNIKHNRPGKIQTSGGSGSNSSGYKFISMNIGGGKTSTKYVHRMVAMAFIPIPAEFLEYADILQVNHKDGNKTNNAVSNLEWVTAAGNIKHVLENGLKTLNKCLAKNLNTGEIREFPSSEHLAREFGISIKRLRRHLDSEFAGYHSKDYWVFKYKNNGKDWPVVTEDLIIPDRWDRNYGIWVANNIRDKAVPTAMAAKLEDLCNGIGMKYYSVQPEVRADGRDWVVQTWKFTYYSIPTAAMLDAVNYKKENKFRPIRKIKVTITGSQRKPNVYSSLREACAATGVSMTTVLYAINRKNGVHGQFLFEYEGTVLPALQGDKQ